LKNLFLKKSGHVLHAADTLNDEVLAGMKNGEYMCELTRPRNIRFHRKYFALLKFSFDHWEIGDEEYRNFDVYRKNIAILAGFYVQAYNMKGEVVLEPRSLNFGAMDDIEFDKLYQKTITVILQNVLKGYTKDDLERVVQEILGFA
jgi:Protein of unknown function (DUF1367)